MRQLGATILACLFVAPVAAEEPPLGRLLLTPEQRAALDVARRNKIRADATHKAKPAPAERDVTLNGVVKRSDGESTVWVNGRPVESETDDGTRVYVLAGARASVVIRTADAGRTFKLKVGQRADLVTGKIAESYESRRAQVEEEPAQAESTNTAAADNVRESSSPEPRRDRLEEREPGSRAPQSEGNSQDR